MKTKFLNFLMTILTLAIMFSSSIIVEVQAAATAKTDEWKINRAPGISIKNTTEYKDVEFTVSDSDGLQEKNIKLYYYETVNKAESKILINDELERVTDTDYYTKDKISDKKWKFTLKNEFLYFIIQFADGLKFNLKMTDNKGNKSNMVFVIYNNGRGYSVNLAPRVVNFKVDKKVTFSVKDARGIRKVRFFDMNNAGAEVKSLAKKDLGAGVKDMSFRLSKNFKEVNGEYKIKIYTEDIPMIFHNKKIDPDRIRKWNSLGSTRIITIKKNMPENNQNTTTNTTNTSNSSTNSGTNRTTSGETGITNQIPTGYYFVNHQFFYNGNPVNDLHNGIYYVNGYRATGVYNGVYYEDGYKGSGTYNGIKYQDGTPFSGQEGKYIYGNGIVVGMKEESVRYEKVISYKVEDTVSFHSSTLDAATKEIIKYWKHDLKKYEILGTFEGQTYVGGMKTGNCIETKTIVNTNPNTLNSF